VISFLLHGIALLIPGFWLGRRLRLPWALLVGTMFLIFEASLVVGAGLLSWAALLGRLHAYQFVTTLCAMGIAAALWLIARLRGPVSDTTSQETADLNLGLTQLSARLLYIASIAGIVVFGALLLFLALNAYPAVEDALTIKLPKVVFAIQANSILPTNFTDDGRMYITPIYPALVQIFLIINGQKGHALLVFGFINWAVCGIALYHICRYVGATTLSSLVVTALVLLSPILMAQGSSEGDDLIAATPFVLGVMFLLPALQERDPFCAVLAGIGVGLSLAMKFLPVFYLPALAVLIVVILLSDGGLKWLRKRVGTALWFSAGFVFALLPNAAANWVAFGDPFYVSDAVVKVSRNWPFSAECAVRATVGHLKQLVLSDAVRLTASLTTVIFDPAIFDRAAMYQVYWSKVIAYGNFVSGIFPYNPIPTCTAYGTPFELTNPYLDENTLWFGVVGPLLLIASIVVIVSSPLLPVVRALGLGFLGWELAFDFTTRYYGENGRYYSMAVLVGAPTIAVLLDRLMRRQWGARLALLGLGAAGVTTAFLGVEVLTEDAHRSLPAALTTSRYSSMLMPDASASIAKARAVNVQVLYGINTYDYYVRLGPKATLFNKVAIMDDTINIVAVRPFGIIDNPFGDPRIPVRMRRPFAGGFRFIGENPGQNLSFANNMQLTSSAPVDAKSSYLIFEGWGIKKDGQTISGFVDQIASTAIKAKMRYRIGWRETGGTAVMPPEWHRGATQAEFQVPERAAMLVIEAAFDDDNEVSSSQWPMKGFLTGVGPEMVRMFAKQ
jgi:hypothetical protein